MRHLVVSPQKYIMVKAFLRIEEGFVSSEDEFFASWKIRLPKEKTCGETIH
jgi:hypothetical protein